MSKHKQNDSVKQIMTAALETLTEQSKISDAAKIFKENSFHHLPVVSGNKIVGMFSFSDFLKIDFSESFGQDKREVLAILDSSKTIGDVMSTHLTMLKETVTIKEAAKTLCSGKFHSLPVTNDDEELVGLVTSTDIIEYYAEL